MKSDFEIFSRAVVRYVHIGTNIDYWLLDCGHRHYPACSPHRLDEQKRVRCPECEAGKPCEEFSVGESTAVANDDSWWLRERTDTR
jgi:hypothetical protein